MARYPRWRRRTLMVNRRVQLRFISLLLLQMSFILSALGILIHSHVTRTAEIAEAVPFVDTHTRMAIQNELIDNIHGFYVRSLVLIAVTAAVMILFGLLASHKLAGPVVKLQHYLNAVADGDYSQRIAFRHKDHLEPFAESINRTVESIESKRARARELGTQLAARSAELESGPRRLRLIAEMEGMVAELRGAI